MEERNVQQLIGAIDCKRKQLIALGDRLFCMPELGFFEEKTAQVVADVFKDLGLDCQEQVAVSGVIGTLDSGKPGPHIAVLGELDALICPHHPQADPITGAAHTCGHHAQVIAMLGAATGIVQSGIVDHLSGRISFMGVPAEQYIDLENRQRLKEEGKIEYFGGKQEFIRLGHFDDVDLSLMVHCSTDGHMIHDSSNGFIAKHIKYLGEAGHAASMDPEKSVNALYAAVLGLTAINALRETFHERDSIRVHPIISQGGYVQNVIPSYVTMETFVRGKTVEAFQKAASRVDRALYGGALSMGASLMIQDLGGYLPLQNNRRLMHVFEKSLKVLGLKYRREEFRTGSTDMGDLSHLLPVIHPYMGNNTGVLHSPTFRVQDPESTYIEPAKVMALTVFSLLFNHANTAEEIIASYQPVLTKETYLQLIDSLFQVKEYS